ncbi:MULTISPECIES: DUF3040 domain-containing protein [Actinomadura]|uniref:DUF3040 domain-containing protein n=2 Tax=Actinomadura yumaensis TaxID=111807 RepID=A0ABW2CZC2_9ACTN|nr:DUF3040 domain-containing protein [Actinomadura sp. J1-007]MWK39191.1 DUF3040 domain-containing protein [Actinomadura sp. J1-007]
MPLSETESRALERLARRTAAEDPEYARRLAAFGGYEASPLGLPSAWTLLPVVLAVLLLLAVLFAAALAGHRHTAPSHTPASPPRAGAHAPAAPIAPHA